MVAPPSSISNAFLRPISRGSIAAATGLKTPPRDLRMAELRAGRGQHDVAPGPPGCSRRPSAAPATRPQRGLVQLCRFSKTPWNSSSITYARSPMWSARSNPAEKYLPEPDTHDQLDVPLVLERLERGVQLLHHLDREHVGRWPVQVDARDALGGLEVDERVRRVRCDA